MPFKIRNNFWRRLVLFFYTPLSFVIILPLAFIMWLIYGGLINALSHTVDEFLSIPKNFASDWKELPPEDTENESQTDQESPRS